MRLLAHSIAVTALVAGAACDTTPRGRDAAAGGQKVSEVAIRFEVAGDAPPSVTMLAYRAMIFGVGSDDVLSVVDPLTAPAPDGLCSVREVTGAARALGAAGGKVELEALAGWHLDLGGGRLPVAPSPRVYPDLAAVVGGVVAEAGPIDLLADFKRDADLDRDGRVSLAGVRQEGTEAATPPAGVDSAESWLTGLALVDATGSRVALVPPSRPHLVGPEGGALPPNSSVQVSGDLVLGVQSAGPTFLELRPFGATWALACPVGHDRVTVPAADVARLASLRVPVSVEAVARESRPLVLGGTPVRLTVEVRSSSVVELRP